jgi:hypothetical protein
VHAMTSAGGRAARRRTLGTSRSFRESSDAIFVFLPLPLVRPLYKKYYKKKTESGGPVRAPLLQVRTARGGGKSEYFVDQERRA